MESHPSPQVVLAQSLAHILLPSLPMVELFPHPQLTSTEQLLELVATFKQRLAPSETSLSVAQYVKLQGKTTSSLKFSFSISAYPSLVILIRSFARDLIPISYYEALSIHPSFSVHYLLRLQRSLIR